LCFCFPPLLPHSAHFVEFDLQTGRLNK
jgi:hypothetical protein